MIDLTTLDGKDTPENVKRMCYKANHLHDSLQGIPKVAAVCVYPTMVKYAKKELKGTKINVASVATLSVVITSFSLVSVLIIIIIIISSVCVWSTWIVSYVSRIPFFGVVSCSSGFSCNPSAWWSCYVICASSYVFCSGNRNPSWGISHGVTICS